MADIKINPVNKVRGTPIIPPDKSISHRAIMLASLASGKSVINNFLNGEDCLRTIDAFRNLGVNIVLNKTGQAFPQIIVEGMGLDSLRQSPDVLYLGNSGTSMRLIMGILAGQNFSTVLTGDESLSSRPMKRVSIPLCRMGAKIDGRDNGNFAPLTITGKRPLKAINYKSDVASAQVKSAILFAGMFADAESSVIEPAKSRDHSERMLKFFGADVISEGLRASIKPFPDLKAREIFVPGDISSAAFFIAAGLIVAQSEILLRGINLNPTRTGLLDALSLMGADIQIMPKAGPSAEPVGDLLIKHSRLKGITLEEEMLPRLIDELPVLMIMATQAHGTTIIRNAKELRVKETDRINSMAQGLKAMGADVRVEGDTITINGPVSLEAAKISSYADHRTAMSFIIAGLIAKGQTIVDDTECIETSFPDFIKTLKSLMG